MNKIYITMALILFCICCVVGVLTKKSYVDDTSVRDYIDNEQLELFVVEDFNNEFEDDENVKNLDMLTERSDYIVRVRVNSDCERYLHSEMSVSRVEVLENYKGSTDEYIYVLEPIGVFKFEEGMRIQSVDNYYWMRDGEEYILFLDKYKDKHIGRDKYIYMPISASRGQYCITDKANPHPFDTPLFRQ